MTGADDRISADPTDDGWTRVDLPAAEDTDALGARLAAALTPGDVLALSGPLGAGKSALARAVIGERLTAAGRPPEPTPSPTYTLAQVYDAGPVSIVHADLYRLGGWEEAEELGLLDPDPTAIWLIEWAERLGPALPTRRLEIALAIPAPTGDAAPGRRLSARGVGPGWAAALAAITGDGA